MTTSDQPLTQPLEHLTEGQLLVYGGDRIAVVPAGLAQSFVAGDRLVIVQESGDLLHIPRAEHTLVSAAVAQAVDAFAMLAQCTDDQITEFFERFADAIDDDAAFGPVIDANGTDVGAATARGRSTTRLVLSPGMRSGMAAGLRSWGASPIRRQQLLSTIDHDTWSVSSWRAPLGVVGFVFEGRPNVFADATGVLRTGNTAVFRIGSDALGTAQAIMRHCVAPALAAAGLPAGAVQLVESAAHAAGWALFSDHRLGLAVARGSGAAVAQLGAVARQHGVPVSLHGTGGAWMVVSESADAAVLGETVEHSLDRKVCNTMNVCCIPKSRSAELRAVVEAAAQRAAATRGTEAVMHEVGSGDTRPPGRGVGVGGRAGVLGCRRRVRRRGDRAVQPVQSPLLRVPDQRRRRASTIGSTQRSMHRSSAMASPDGSTGSSPSTSRSWACRTGRQGGSSREAVCCRATRSTPCGCAPRSATTLFIVDGIVAPRASTEGRPGLGRRHLSDHLPRGCATSPGVVSTEARSGKNQVATTVPDDGSVSPTTTGPVDTPADHRGLVVPCLRRPWCRSMRTGSATRCSRHWETPASTWSTTPSRWSTTRRRTGSRPPCTSIS